MTIKTKIRNLKRVRTTIKSDKEYCFCYALLEFSNEQGEIQGYPELLRFKPKRIGIGEGGFWFNISTREGKQKRIAILNKVIKQLESKLKQKK